MRKYSRALIFAVSLLALAGLFLYRNEYIKLKSTFELFDILNSDTGFAVKNCLVFNETFDSEDVKTLSFPRPMWKPVGDFYFYSAFGERNDGKYSVKAIGAGGPADSINYHCHIWYSFKDTVLSTNGKFRYTSMRIEGTDRLYYEFICDEVESDIKGQPYMLVLIDVTEGRKYFVPIFRPVVENTSASAALCVYPDITGLPQSLLVEFLSFHEIIGFTDILVYDFGLHYGFLEKVNTIVTKSHAFRSFSILDWNFPFNAKASKYLLEKDCQYRTSRQVKVVVALGWNDYLIPKGGLTQNQFFINHTSLVNTQVETNTQICCVDKRNTKGSEKSWPRVLRKTECANQPRDNFIVMNPKLRRLEHTEKLIVTQGAISIYGNCYNIGQKVSFDPNALDYVAKLMTSKILRLWKSGTFFS